MVFTVGSGSVSGILALAPRMIVSGDGCMMAEQVVVPANVPDDDTVPTEAKSAGGRVNVSGGWFLTGTGGSTRSHTCTCMFTFVPCCVTSASSRRSDSSAVALITAAACTSTSSLTRMPNRPLVSNEEPAVQGGGPHAGGGGLVSSPQPT